MLCFFWGGTPEHTPAVLLMHCSTLDWVSAITAMFIKVVYGLFRLCFYGINTQGGVWVGPTNGRLFKLDFPSAKFWVNIFFGWVGLRAKGAPPPPFV